MAISDGSGPAGPAEVNRRILPPALETLTAWTMACEEDPRFFHDAMRRVLADALRSEDPQRGLAELMFGMTSLSGILLDELAASSGRCPSDLIGEIHARYLDGDAGSGAGSVDGVPAVDDEHRSGDERRRG